MREPDGCTFEDRQTGELRHEPRFLVLDGDKWRILALRVGRGIVRDATPEERKAAMRTLASNGGKAAAAKLSKEQRVERSQKANQSLTPEQRIERARKAGIARHAKGKS